MALYEDPLFSPRFISLPPHQNVVWRRPKDIVAVPKFFGTHFSPNQCWEDHFERRKEVRGSRSGFLLIAVAALTKNIDKFLKVVPEQRFDVGYNGQFRFNFFERGVQKEITIDDRLPTDSFGRQIPSECVGDAFWFPLLEKAYAKFRGGYDQIATGVLYEVLHHLTGRDAECLQNGIGSSLPFTPDGMYSKLKNLIDRGCLIICKLKDGNGNNENHGSGFTITAICSRKRLSNDGIEGRGWFVKLRHPTGIIEKNLADRIGISVTSNDGEGFLEVEKFVSKMQCVYFVDVSVVSLRRDPGLDAFVPFIPTAPPNNAAKHRCRK